MLGNFIRRAFRGIQKQKGYSLINLSGLAIGMTCFILISIYVRYEFSYDRFHADSQNIYRVLADTGEEYRGKTQVAVTTAPLAGALRDSFPEVLDATKLMDDGVEIKFGEQRLAETRVYYGEPAFLRMFDFPLISGNPETALEQPFSLLISRDMADKYFPRSDALGETLNIDGRDFQITGVLENIPGNTHFDFDYMLSFSSLVEQESKEKIYSWNQWSYYTYVRLHEQASPSALEQKLPGMLTKHTPNATQGLCLQPIAGIHLHTQANFELSANGDIRNIYLLSAIGLFILLIACFNYMNLSTARATTRAREVGLHKVIGARRGQLIRRFLGESLLFSFLTLILSLILVKLLLPAFRIFVGCELEIGFVMSGSLLLTLVGLVFVIGLLSGSYPALILSSFQPAVVLKGTQAPGSRSPSLFRSILVVCQFTISVALIISTLIVNRQLHFMRNKDLGFTRDLVVTVRNPQRGSNAFKNELLRDPQIQGAAHSNRLPHNTTSASVGTWEGRNPEEKLLVYTNRVDDDFLDFYGIPVIAGRGFSREFNDETDRAFILNQTAVKAIGWRNPIGKRFGFDKDNMGVVVGIVKDFHFAPLHLNIGPLALSPSEKGSDRWLSLKISPDDIPATIAFIEKTWKAHSPEGIFSYSFMDDRLDRMYRTERKLVDSFKTYTLLALFVACLGLFGLSSFATARRTREIGIRKVLGAGGWSITLLTTKKFLSLVLIANAAAAPAAWFAMRMWLENFAYRTSIGAEVFVLSTAASLMVALLTVGYQSGKAALADPVKSLRHE